jgi:hypothetical protein
MRAVVKNALKWLNIRDLERKSIVAYFYKIPVHQFGTEAQFMNFRGNFGFAFKNKWSQPKVKTMDDLQKLEKYIIPFL